MRFRMEPDNVEGFGDCWKLIDSQGVFNDWHSMSHDDLEHLISFLNSQEERINDVENMLMDFHDLVYNILYEHIDKSIKEGTDDVFVLQDVAEEIGLELDYEVVKEDKKQEAENTYYNY